jgi:hypothetical protein
MKSIGKSIQAHRSYEMGWKINPGAPRLWFGLETNAVDPWFLDW